MPDFGTFAAWSSRKRIDLPVPTADLVDFPNCIKIVADADMTEALANGHDIRFTAADGVTELPYERDEWTGGAGSDVTAIFWVKTDVSTAGTYIWLYYGNAAATDVSTVVRDTEYVANGNFDSDVAGWTLLDCTAASVAGGITGNCAELTRTGAATQAFYRSVAGLTIGIDYRFSGWIKSGTSLDDNFQFTFFDSAFGLMTSTGVIPSTGAWVKHSSVFTATDVAGYWFWYKQSATPGTKFGDTFSVKIYHSASWSAYEDAQELVADGGLTWGDEEHQSAPAGGGKPMNLKLKL